MQGEQNLPGRAGLLVAHRGDTQSSEGYAGQVGVSSPHRHNPCSDCVKVHPHKAQLGARSLCPAHIPSKPWMLCGVECGQAAATFCSDWWLWPGREEAGTAERREGQCLSPKHQLPGLTLV